MYKILLIGLSILLSGCSGKVQNTFVECDCETVHEGQLTATPAGSRFTDTAFGSAQCRTAELAPKDGNSLPTKTGRTWRKVLV